MFSVSALVAQRAPSAISSARPRPPSTVRALMHAFFSQKKKCRPSLPHPVQHPQLLPIPQLGFPGHRLQPGARPGLRQARWGRGQPSIGRLYLPAGVDPGKKLPVIMFFHGGAFMVHTATSRLYHIYSATLATTAPTTVVSVDYRLAPEQRIPAAYDDAFVVLKPIIATCRADGAEAQAEPLLATHGDASHIVLAGDSAGGNMAHNVAIRLRKEGGFEGYGDMVSGIVLLHPYFWGKEPLGVEPRDPGYSAMFHPTWEFIWGGKFGLDHSYVNPMVSPEEWRQLGSRCVLVTKKCGWEGELEFYETKGEAHVFFLPKHGSDNAVKELAIMAEFVRHC